MPTPSEVPFARPPLAASAGNFESEAVAAPPNTTQKSRVADLFLRGAISAEEAARAKATPGGFEAIVGRPNFLPASFLEVGAASSRATCLVLRCGNRLSRPSCAWTGTGFLISPNLLVTNNHVVNDELVAAGATAVFDFEVGADGRPRTPVSFALRPDRLFLTSRAQGGFDYTVCWVDGEPGRTYGAVRVSRAAFPIAAGEFANVVSHPAGRRKEVALQQNEVQWQDDFVVHYTSDTESGSSGAAVCNNSWQLVALHHASQPSNVPEYTLLNEGIKLSAIAANLELRARQGSAPAAEVLAHFGGADERLGFFGGLGRPTPAGVGLEAVVNSFAGTEHDLDIGFWNVEWLSDRYPMKAAAVARVVHQLNLDVWALSESSPNAAAAVAAELAETFGLNYGHAAAEPGSGDHKQSCTLLWDKSTATVTPEPWGEPVETWLAARSRDFDDLGLGGFEAVHGRIFDRTPALFRVTSTKPGPGGAPLSFYLVPLHLKAKDEGSMRRRMASRILAEAVARKSAETGLDFIVGGDANAPLASGDFANLTDAGLIAASAADAASGAFSYVKGPKSLIDHVFLSPNLATDTAADFFVVALDKSLPDYVRDVSDHRPVLARLSLGGSTDPGGPESVGAAEGDPKALAELKARLAGFDLAAASEPAVGGFEATPNLAGRVGYDPAFLGSGLDVPLPGLPPAGPEVEPVEFDATLSGAARFALPYTHFSVALNAHRRMAFYSAVNIDGGRARRVARDNSWFLDPRASAAAQSDNSVYKNNDLDRGHLTRRLDPVWGTESEARRDEHRHLLLLERLPATQGLEPEGVAEARRLRPEQREDARAEGQRVHRPCLRAGRPAVPRHPHPARVLEGRRHPPCRHRSTFGDRLPAEPGRHGQRLRVRLRRVQDLPGAAGVDRVKDRPRLRPPPRRRPPRRRLRVDCGDGSDGAGEFATGIVLRLNPTDR